MQPYKVATWSEVPDREPVGALVSNVDLVIVRFDGNHSVLYGRCLHRGALMCDGRIAGDNIICGLHGWDYVFHTGVSSYDNSERLAKFSSWLDGDDLMVDLDEVLAWEKEHPQPYDRAAYQGAYQDPHGDAAEPHVGLIRRLADEGLEYLGHHGPVTSDGGAPHRVAELGRHPVHDRPTGEAAPPRRRARRHRGRDRPQRGPAPAPGDPHPGERHELRGAVGGGQGGPGPGRAAVRHGHLLGRGAGCCPPSGTRTPGTSTSWPAASSAGRWTRRPAARPSTSSWARGAKTGTGGHLPGVKVQGKIAEVRGLEPGTAAISPSTFVDFCNEDDYRRFADEVREASGGIPIGVKMSAQHIEDDIDAALRVGVDYIILDGRGGGTGAAPVIFRDNISVPTIPALARARRHLDSRGRRDVTLVVTGGLRTPADFAKALALGADAVAVSNAAMQAIGCLGMRACSTNNCPVGIATQRPELRARLPVEEAAERLHKFFCASVELMCVLARACGHGHLDEFCADDLTTFDRDMAHLTDVCYGGVRL